MLEHRAQHSGPDTARRWLRTPQKKSALHQISRRTSEHAGTPVPCLGGCHTGASWCVSLGCPCGWIFEEQAGHGARAARRRCCACCLLVCLLLSVGASAYPAKLLMDRTRAMVPCNGGYVALSTSISSSSHASGPRSSRILRHRFWAGSRYLVFRQCACLPALLLLI